MKQKTYMVSFAVLAILSLGGYFFYITQKDTYIDEITLSVPLSGIQVTLAGENLIKEATTLVVTETLKPEFVIKYKKYEPENIIIDGIDILTDDFFLEPNTVQRDRNTIKFNLPFLLKPGKHQLLINYTISGNLFEENYSFELGLYNTFDRSITESEFLLIPKSTLQTYSKSWYVYDGNLIIDTIKGNSHASLAFLYPVEDIRVNFEFTPHGKTLNLVFYFLESGKSIVIGNGNNQRITFLRKGDNSIEGSQFVLERGNTYSAYVQRISGTYELYIKEGKLDEQIFNSNNRVLSVISDDNGKQDNIGFSVWAGSDGVNIDNLTIFPPKI